MARCAHAKTAWPASRLCRCLHEEHEPRPFMYLLHSHVSSISVALNTLHCSRRATGLQVLVEPVGPTSVRSCLVAALDPSRSPLPKWMINFIIKYLLGVLFYMQVSTCMCCTVSSHWIVSILQHIGTEQANVAKKCKTSPTKSAHAKMVASKPEFYRDWVCVKVTPALYFHVMTCTHWQVSFICLSHR